MKRFDVAIEISKQLISLSSALLLGIAALAQNILVNESDPKVFTCLIFLYVFLVMSIISGVVNLGAITNIIETIEKRIYQKSYENVFESSFNNPFILYSGIAQQILFLLAVVLLVITLIIDRTV